MMMMMEGLRTRSNIGNGGERRTELNRDYGRGHHRSGVKRNFVKGQEDNVSTDSWPRA